MTDQIQDETSGDDELYQYLAQSGGYSIPEEKYNVHLFLHRVATADDTTKVGNLTMEEIGIPKYPNRLLKELALISSNLGNNKVFNEFFTKQSEILTSTSLSKEGFLVRQGTTTTRQVADITKAPKKPNKGWFKKKEKGGGEEQ